MLTDKDFSDYRTGANMFTTRSPPDGRRISAASGSPFVSFLCNMSKSALLRFMRTVEPPKAGDPSLGSALSAICADGPPYGLQATQQ